MNTVFVLYQTAQKRGMDSSITFNDYQKLDDAVVKGLVALKLDEQANTIITKPINELTKSDVSYVINFNSKPLQLVLF